MDDKKVRFNSVDEYIATFPEDIQAILQEIRATIRSVAPDAEEKISYQMPTFAQHGILVHFAAWKKHIGFYPATNAIEVFADDLASYESAKGSIKFPLDQPMPYDLIRKITEFRVAQNLEKAAHKKSRKQK